MIIICERPDDICQSVKFEALSLDPNLKAGALNNKQLKVLLKNQKKRSATNRCTWNDFSDRSLQYLVGIDPSKDCAGKGLLIKFCVFKVCYVL